jgi:hypothetical protein
MAKDDSHTDSAENRNRSDNLTEVKLFVPDQLARAWQRCSWLLVHDTGRERIDIMKEMVNDFLVKHGC